jgi:hypothetical protein
MLNVNDKVKCIKGSIQIYKWKDEEKQIDYEGFDTIKKEEVFEVYRVSGTHIQLRKQDGSLTQFFHPSVNFEVINV